MKHFLSIGFSPSHGQRTQPRRKAGDHSLYTAHLRNASRLGRKSSPSSNTTAFVTAVQDPLTSLPDDIATLRRALEGQKGPVVLVGHSYGGAVNYGRGSQQSKGQVARSTCAGVCDPTRRTACRGRPEFPAPRLNAALVPDSGLLHSIAQSFRRENFCQTSSGARKRAVMAATQNAAAQIRVRARRCPEAAWRRYPSCTFVSSRRPAPSIPSSSAFTRSARAQRRRRSHRATFSFSLPSKEVAER